MKRQSFVHGAAVLAAAGIVVKIIGACFKIPLGAVLGPEGMANFSIAYNIYALLFVLSTAGVPAAVSKMISEATAFGKYAEARRIYKISYLAFAVTGAFGFAVMAFGADFFARFMGSPDAAVSIRAIAPAVMFVSVSSINRGYYQGHANMYPTAVSEIIEAFGKLIIGLTAAWWLAKSGFGDSMVSAGAVLGVSAGAALSAVYFAFLRGDKISGTGKYAGRRKRDILRELMHLAVPITLGAAVISLTNVIDSALVMNTLQRTGFTLREAKWLYGSYNYAANLFNMPSTLVTTIAVALIPAISAAYAKRDFASLDATANSALKLAMLVALPSAGGMYALAHPLIDLLYGASIEAEAVLAAGRMLASLSLAVPFLAVVSLTNAIHQSLGSVRFPVFSMLIGAAVKLLANLVLVSRPGINIYGAPISTTLCYAVIAAINMAKLRKCGFISISSVAVFAKPMLVGAVTGLTAYLFETRIYTASHPKFFTVLSVVAGLAACLACVISTKTLNKDDMKLISGDKRVFKFFNIH